MAYFIDPMGSEFKKALEEVAAELDSEENSENKEEEQKGKKSQKTHQHRATQKEKKKRFSTKTKRALR